MSGDGPWALPDLKPLPVWGRRRPKQKLSPKEVLNASLESPFPSGPHVPGRLSSLLCLLATPCASRGEVHGASSEHTPRATHATLRTQRPLHPTTWGRTGQRDPGLRKTHCLALLCLNVPTSAAISRRSLLKCRLHLFSNLLVSVTLITLINTCLVNVMKYENRSKAVFMKANMASI